MGRRPRRVGDAPRTRSGRGRPGTAFRQPAARVGVAKTTRVGWTSRDVLRPHRGGPRQGHSGAGYPGPSTGRNRVPVLRPAAPVPARRGARATRWGRRQSVRVDTGAASAGGLLLLLPLRALGVGVPRPVPRSPGARARFARGRRGGPERARSRAAPAPASGRGSAVRASAAGRGRLRGHSAGHRFVRPRRGNRRPGLPGRPSRRRRELLRGVVRRGR